MRVIESLVPVAKQMACLLCLHTMLPTTHRTAAVLITWSHVYTVPPRLSEAKKPGLHKQVADAAVLVEEYKGHASHDVAPPMP